MCMLAMLLIRVIRFGGTIVDVPSKQCGLFCDVVSWAVVDVRFPDDCSTCDVDFRTTSVFLVFTAISCVLCCAAAGSVVELLVLGGRRVAAMADGAPDAKRPRTEDGTMPADLIAKIEALLAAIRQVEHHRRPHCKGPRADQARCLPPEDLVHEKVLRLQEASEEVLERSLNFMPDGYDKEYRMQMVMGMRHFQSQAWGYGETNLAKRITDQKRCFLRLNNMIRGTDHGKNVPLETT